MFGGRVDLNLCEVHLCVASTLRSMRQVWQYVSLGVCMDDSLKVLAVVTIVWEVVLMVLVAWLCFALA